MYKETEISDEEQKEAMRHDNFYREKRRAWKFSSHDWEKFDLVEKPTHGYLYSIKCLGDIKDKNVLDLGCGTGWLSVILAKRGANVEALDISAEAIHLAQNMAAINKVDDKIHFKAGSVYELEYPSNSFDFVVGQAILHHLSNKDIVAQAVYRVLKPKGKAVFFETFGDSRLLQKIRLLIPITIDGEIDDWEKKVKYSDIDTFKKYFAVNCKEFHLLSRLDRIFSSQAITEFLGQVDFKLLKWFPFLRRYARHIVVELSKK